MINLRMRYIQLVVISMALLVQGQAHAGISFIAKGSIPGNATDSSGLKGNLEDGTPSNRMGSFGSAIAYTGVGNRFIAVADRGPADGTTSFINRLYEFDLIVNWTSLTPKLVNTILLSNGQNKYYMGSSSAFDETTHFQDLRLDSEALRVSRENTIFIADEYGLHIYEFDRSTGKRLKSLIIPRKFLITKPDKDEKKELPPNNISGRQSNRGVEGLAISPNGRVLTGIMQSPLIQDHGLNEQNKRVGLNVRILSINLSTSQRKEYLYPLDNKDNGVNEILAVNDDEFLVIERDSTAGNFAVTKKIYKINITDATNISGIASLPQDSIPENVKPVQKSLFLDLLDPTFGLAGLNFPEKIEGLAWGPDFPDGRHMLVVSSDNDFKADEASNLYVFAVDGKSLPNFQPQEIIP